MHEAIDLALKPLAQYIPIGQDENSLEKLIPVIASQRHPYRGLSEASLQEEIENPPIPKADHAKSSGKELDKEMSEESVKSPKHLIEVREALSQLIGRALNEQALASDLVSLLLSGTGSGERKIAAANAMSPALKACVPAGSLSLNKFSNPPSSASTVDSKLKTLGFHAQGLSNVSANLSVASGRLRKEVEKNKVYWNQLETQVAGKWPLRRVRRHQSDKSGVMGIKFGPAASHLVLLKASPEGPVDVGGSLQNMELQALQYTVLDRDGHVMAKFMTSVADSTLAQTLSRSSPPVQGPTSCEQDVSSGSEELERQDLDKSLRNARKSILAQTVFRELMRECRNPSMLRYGITVEFGKIKLDTFVLGQQQLTLETELVAIERQSPAISSDIQSIFVQDSGNASSQEYTKFLKIWHSAISLLASQKLENQSSKRGVVKPIMAPLLSWISNAAQVRILQGLLTQLVATLKSTLLPGYETNSVNLLENTPNDDLITIFHLQTFSETSQKRLRVRTPDFHKTESEYSNSEVFSIQTCSEKGAGRVVLKTNSIEEIEEYLLWDCQQSLMALLCTARADDTLEPISESDVNGSARPLLFRQIDDKTLVRLSDRVELYVILDIDRVTVEACNDFSRNKHELSRQDTAQSLLNTCLTYAR